MRIRYMCAVWKLEGWQLIGLRVVLAVAPAAAIASLAPTTQALIGTALVAGLCAPLDTGEEPVTGVVHLAVVGVARFPRAFGVVGLRHLEEGQ